MITPSDVNNRASAARRAAGLLLPWLLPVYDAATVRQADA